MCRAGDRHCSQWSPPLHVFLWFGQNGQVLGYGVQQGMCSANPPQQKQPLLCHVASAEVHFQCRQVCAVTHISAAPVWNSSLDSAPNWWHELWPPHLSTGGCSPRWRLAVAARINLADPSRSDCHKCLIIHICNLLHLISTSGLCSTWQAYTQHL